MAVGQEFVFSHVSAASQLSAALRLHRPLFSSSSPPLRVQSEGSWRESHGQEVLNVHPTVLRGAATGCLLSSAGKVGLRVKCV